MKLYPHCPICVHCVVLNAVWMKFTFLHPPVSNFIKDRTINSRLSRVKVSRDMPRWPKGFQVD